MKKLFYAGIIITLLLLSACGGKTPFPSGTLPTSSVPAPDDIIMTPGGGSYRANVYEDGQTNPWPPVQIGMNTWSKGKDTIAVLYRSAIDTKPDESHTDMILVSPGEGSSYTVADLVLYPNSSVPDGITVTNAHTAVGLPGVLGTVLVVTASPDIAAGQYYLEIGVEIAGKDYGVVNCVITVTN